MNISIKNLDPTKLIGAIKAEIDKIDDINLKLRLEWELEDKLRKVQSELSKSAESKIKKLGKDTKLVRCPHCSLFNSRNALAKESLRHDVVEGTYTKAIDLGEWDGWKYENSLVPFLWAKCKYCGKKIYAPNGMYFATPFNGSVYQSPQSYSR